MFSFIKKYAETLNGVDIYGDIGLVLFIVVFAAMTLVALKASKSYVAELSQMPFDDSTNDSHIKS